MFFSEATFENNHGVRSYLSDGVSVSSSCSLVFIATLDLTFI